MTEKVHIAVDNRLRLKLAAIDPETADELRIAFTYANPQYAKLKAFGIRKRVPKALRTWAEDEGELNLPRGGLGKLRAVLRERGYLWTVSDERSVGYENTRSHGGRAVPEHRVKLWDFQERLVEAALKRENCLWRSPQGSGKTTASIAFASRANLPALFIVSTGNLLDQWIKRCRKELGIEPGVIQGSRRRVEDVTVGMQQTLRNCAQDLRGRFGVVVCDEVQEFAARTFQDVIDELDCRYRLGVSADEKRSDGLEFLIYDQFGDVAAEVGHAELVERGFIHEVEVRVVLSRFEAPWYVALTKTKAKIAAYDRLLEQMGNDEERNALVLGCLTRGLEDGEQVIVLANRREHCHTIDQLATAQGESSGLLIGGDDYRQQFESTLARLEAGEARVGVGTLQAIGVGFDYPRIARGVIATPIANNQKGDKQFRQFRGRFARTTEGKRDAVLYYVHDPSVFGARPIRHLNRWSKRVKVRVGRDNWIDGKQYLQETKRHEKARSDEPTLDEVLGR